MMGENERGERMQTTFSSYNQFEAPYHAATPSSAQKLSPQYMTLARRYRRATIFSLIQLCLLTAIIVPLIFFIDGRVMLVASLILITLYYFAIRLFLLKR
jgi:hypothetical protein